SSWCGLCSSPSFVHVLPGSLQRRKCPDDAPPTRRAGDQRVQQDRKLGSRDASSAGERPKVGVLYDPHSTFALKVRGWVGDYCDLAWIIDDALGPIAESERTILARLGSVVDISGADAERTVQMVAQCDLSGIVTFADRRIRL